MSSNQLVTPKSQVGLNYAKLRNKTKKQNNSSLENAEAAYQADSMQLQFNQDNLYYVERLIRTKQINNKQSEDKDQLKRNHQRAKSTLEEKPLSKEQLNLRSYRESVTQNILQPSKLNKPELKVANLNKSSCSDYGKPNLLVQSNLESSFPEKFTSKHNQDPETDKLFDQFFKLNNSKSDSDFLRETTSYQPQALAGFMSHQIYPDEENTDRYTNPKKPKKTDDFLRFLDQSITYLTKTEAINPSLVNQMPISKQMAQQLSVSQTEVQRLRSQNQKLETKLNEYKQAKRQLNHNLAISEQRGEEINKKFMELKVSFFLAKRDLQRAEKSKKVLESQLNKLKSDNTRFIQIMEQLVQYGAFNKQQRDVLQAAGLSVGRKSNMDNFSSKRHGLYDPNSVIDEAESSVTDDRSELHYAFKDFQTNESIDDKEYTVTRRDEIARKNHLSQIDGQIQQMMMKQNYKDLSVNQKRKKQIDLFYNEEDDS